MITLLKSRRNKILLLVLVASSFFFAAAVAARCVVLRRAARVGSQEHEPPDLEGGRPPPSPRPTTAPTPLIDGAAGRTDEAARLAAASAPAPNAGSRPPTELSNSFIVTALQDLQPVLPGGKTPCEFAAARAAGLGAHAFSVVVTAYYGRDGVDATNATAAALTPITSVDHYSFKDVNEGYPNGVKFPRPDAAGLRAWQQGLERCLRAAVGAGFDALQVLGHIDPETGVGWRNFVEVDPLARRAGYTYEDVVVRPAAEAVRAAVGRDTKVWFMVSGEMGRSLWAHPGAYLGLVNKYRGYLSGAGGRTPDKTKVGVALHWNKVCGGCFPTPRIDSPYAYNASYAGLYAAAKDAGALRGYDPAEVRRALEACDVIGLSHYAPAPASGVSRAAFDVPLDTAAHELRQWGIDWGALVRGPKRRELLFSEVGLGGGDPNNERAAPNLAALATNPLNGVWAVYNARQDPWLNAEYRAYRRAWYRALIAFLEAGGSPRYAVDGAFLWSVGSWDAAGVHPISTSSEGTYADWQVVAWMRRLADAAAARRNAARPSR